MKSVSYSQFDVYEACHLRWKLMYIDKLREYSGNIHTLFGTALHETVQEYLKIYFGKKNSVKEFTLVEDFNIEDYLFESMKKIFRKYKEDNTNLGLEITKDDMSEYFQDGVTSINYFCKNISKYCKRKDWNLYDIELPINIHISENVNFNGFLDVVLQSKDGSKYKIIDLKKSYRGWSDNEKKEKRKQLYIYKYYLAKMLNIDINNIEIEYIIFKQKIFSSGQFKIANIQTFEPPAGKRLISEIINSFESFAKSVISEDNEYNIEREYNATPGEKNCKYCQFKNNTELCKFAKLKRK